MPSRLHQTLSELFLNHPPLAAELLTDAFGLDLPPWRQARVESAQIAEVPAAEWRGDALVTLVTADDTAVLAAVVEVQLGTDNDKRYSWPVYVATSGTAGGARPWCWRCVRTRRLPGGPRSRSRWALVR